MGETFVYPDEKSRHRDWVWRGNRLCYTGLPRALTPGGTYVAIDLHEPHFEHIGKYSQAPAILAANLCEIEHAMSLGHSVVTVHYNECRRLTHPRIRARLRSYSKWVEVGKDQRSGAPELLAAFDRHQCGTTLLRLGGLKSDMCIFATMDGLAQVFPEAQIEVVQSACLTSEPSFTWDDFRSWHSHKNVSVVPGVCGNQTAGRLWNVTAMLASELRAIATRAS
jgi:hypothetical protein